MTNMINFIFPTIFFVIFALVFGFLLWGRRLGDRYYREPSDGAGEGLGALDAAVFGLMGLLVALTFTGAASRFDDRRQLITQEVNDIGTAWLRLDLMADPARDEVRQLFREYLDARLAVYAAVSAGKTIDPDFSQVARVQQQIWDRVMLAVREERGVPLATSLVPALNNMFDTATTRTLATKMHPPPAIYVLLMLLILASALLAGFGMAKAKRRSNLHVVVFAACTAVAIYLIIDLEYPRLGFVRVEAYDQALVDLRASME